jgi:metallo-beta-lactamase family protein
MHVTFYGAIREVTGSMHMVATENDRLLLDCGMFQGRRREADEKNRILPFDPNLVTNMVLSHAHIDHSGRIPLLTRENFNGRVVCTRATKAACEYLLPDSAHIQESDADYLNYKALRATLVDMKNPDRKRRASKRTIADIKSILKKGPHEIDHEITEALMDRYRLERVRPLYTRQDADNALAYFDGYPYRHPVTVGRDMTTTLYDAGHIIGSAICIVHARENGQAYTVGYTGDLGRFDKPILEDPTLDFAEQDRRLDLLLMESTYGSRFHEPVRDLKPHLAQILKKTCKRGGTVVIPSFAFGRTQELLYVIHEIHNEGLAPRVPVYVDSPLATKITQVFGEHPELYDIETHNDFLEKGKNPFNASHFHFIGSVEESMALNRDTTPHIVISASGMCEAGRILHHLRFKIHNRKNTILIVGYMARNTLGRRILEEGQAYAASGRKGLPPSVKFLNKEYPLKAEVVSVGGFSAHGDQGEMMRFLKESNLEVKRIAVVHGEEEQSLAFADVLKAEGFTAFVPKTGQTVRVR